MLQRKWNIVIGSGILGLTSIITLLDLPAIYVSTKYGARNLMSAGVALIAIGGIYVMFFYPPIGKVK